MRVLVIASAAMLLSTWLTGCDFVFPCSTAVPRQLPDGSPPGNAAADDGFVAGATRWGEGRNAVLEVVESRSPSETIAPGRPALVWQVTSCRYTVFLDPSLTDPQVIDYAGRI